MYPFITCDIKLANKNASHISGELVAYQQLDIKIIDESSGKRKYYIKDLTNYCVIDNQIFTEIPKNDRFMNISEITLLGDEIPRFIDQNKDWLFTFSDERTKRLLDEQLFIQKDEMDLILLSEPADVTVAAGESCAIPKLKYKNILLDAANISVQMEQEYISIDQKWAKAKDFSKKGIGPMGRLIDGTPIAKIRLKADEMIYRGSDRIRGPWKELMFSEKLWISSGSREEIYIHHLEFLRRHGLNGGAMTGDLASELMLFTHYISYLSRTVKRGSILVLVRKKYFDSCQSTGGFGDSLILTKKRAVEGLPKDFQGVIVAFYNDLEKYPCLTEKRWNLLVLSEPDNLFKTARSNLYHNVYGVRAQVRIGSFSKDYKSMSDQQQIAIFSLFRISNAYNYELPSYYLRHIGETLSLPEPYPIKINTERTMDKPFIIEIEGKTERGIPIPPKTDHWNNQSGITFQSWNLNFKETAIKLVNHTGRIAHPVTFISYKPEYENMTEQQLAWYFYWRTEVRKGNYINSGGDSYVFLYIFELINGVGIKNAEQGFMILQKIYSMYTDNDPHIKARIAKWLLDYILLHDLHWYLPNVLSELENERDYFVKNLIIFQKYLQSDENLDWDIIKELSSYQIQDSRFYQAGNEELLNVHCMEAFSLINNEIRKRYNKTLIQMFCPLKKEKVLRYCYPDAIYYGQSSIKIDIYDFFQHMPLRDFLAAVVKYVENKLRIKQSFNGRLKITLETAWRNIIDESFGDNVQKEKNSRISSVIRIDTNMLSQLRNESDELRQLLINEDEEANNKLPQREIEFIITNHAVPSVDHSENSTLMNRMYLLLGEPFAELLVSMQSNNGCLSKIEAESLLNGIMADAYLDQINECCMEIVNDMLIYEDDGGWYYNEEYQEQIYEFTKGYIATNKAVSVNEDPKGFLDRLSLVQKAFLIMLMENVTAQELTAWGIAQGLMTEVLCDEINELFQNEFGDLLIDTTASPPMIIEEYLEQLKLKNDKVEN